jgi:DNA-binding MarR family transcriptional regulator
MNKLFTNVTKLDYYVYLGKKAKTMVARQKMRPGLADAENLSSDLEDLVGYNLKRAYLVVQDDFRAALGQDGLSPRVFSALSLAMEHTNVTQSELARLLGVERSGLVAIVDDLESRGFLTRTSVPGDRRVQALVPTQAGRDAYAAAAATVRAHEDKLFSDLKADEKQNLMRLLKKIRHMGQGS